MKRIRLDIIWTRCRISAAFTISSKLMRCRQSFIYLIHCLDLFRYVKNSCVLPNSCECLYICLSCLAIVCPNLARESCPTISRFAFSQMLPAVQPLLRQAERPAFTASLVTKKLEKDVYLSSRSRTGVSEKHTELNNQTRI